MNTPDIRDTRIAALREVLERVRDSHDDPEIRDEVREALHQDDKRARGEMDPLLDAGYAMVHGSTPIVVTKDGKRHVGITVRRDTLLPLLVLMKKFFLSLQGTNTHGATSRTVATKDMEMTFYTRGFSPADFNALQSLNWTVGTDLAAEISGTPEMPQMRNDAPKPKTLGDHVMDRVKALPENKIRVWPMCTAQDHEYGPWRPIAGSVDQQRECKHCGDLSFMKG